jgi:hypothetical protein
VGFLVLSRSDLFGRPHPPRDAELAAGIKADY